MKKHIIIALILSLCLCSLTGCGVLFEKLYNIDVDSETSSKSLKDLEEDINKAEQDKNEEEIEIETENEVPDTEPPKQETKVAVDPNYNLINDMTATERRNINVFLSNFSEAGLTEYGYGSPYENFDLLVFAYAHNFYNTDDGTYFEGNRRCITEANVDYSLNKYFGRTVPHETAYGEYGHEFLYENGVFSWEESFGDASRAYSIATSMKNNGNGTYNVEFETFTALLPDILDEAYSYTRETAHANTIYQYTGTAVIKDKVFEGKNTYELITYKFEK